MNNKNRTNPLSEGRNIYRAVFGIKNCALKCEVLNPYAIFNNTIFNKKGIIDETWLFLFYRFIIVCIVALAMVLLVKTYIVTNIEIQETHANLFMYNALNVKEGISYYDSEIQRAYPGIISLDSFQTNLDSRMDYGDHTLIAVKLDLFDITGQLLGTTYYNQEWYERWIVLARTSWTGIGVPTEYFANKTVLIRNDDGTMKQGILQFNVVMPKS